MNNRIVGRQHQVEPGRHQIVHVREMAGVFESARRAMAEEISRAWLGAEADVPLLVGEEPKP